MSVTYGICVHNQVHVHASLLVHDLLFLLWLYVFPRGNIAFYLVDNCNPFLYGCLLRPSLCVTDDRTCLLLDRLSIIKETRGIVHTNMHAFMHNRMWCKFCNIISISWLCLSLIQLCIYIWTLHLTYL